MDDGPDAVAERTPLLLFDGVCNLCNGTVRFVIRHDPGKRVAFAPLQSAAGAAVLDRYGMDPGQRDTFVLVDADGVHTRSTAWGRLLRVLGGPWSLLGNLLLLVPRPLRDAVYGCVARSRYRVFGRRDACMVPGPDVADRFLDPHDLRGRRPGDGDG